MYLFKRIKFLLLCLLPVLVKGQIPVNRSPSSVQVRDARLQAYLNLIAPRYPDTAHANTNKGLDSLGAIIYDSTSNNFYFRGVNASMGHKWIAFGSGSGGGNTIYTADDALISDRTVDISNHLLNFRNISLDNTASFNVNLGSSFTNTSTQITQSAGTIALYANTTASNIGSALIGATYVQLNEHNIANTHFNDIRTYADSMVFWGNNGTYRFRNLNTVGDSATYKPGGYDALGNFVRLSYWPGGTAAGRTFYGRNGLRMRNDSTFTWNGNLDTPTVISGSATYPLRFSGISGGVKFDENPTFNTTSTTGYVWTAVNSSGLGAWQASTGGGSSLTRQTITSGSSGTITAGNYLVTFNPSSPISTYTLTLTPSPNDLDIAEIEAGGIITSGNAVITTLTISPNSGQTLVQAMAPTKIDAGEYIKYRYRAANTSWYREN